MNPLEAALLVVLLTLPLQLLVQRELRRLADPRHIRNSGVMLPDAQALERRGDVLGRYRNQEIYADVVFMGMVYRFERVAAR